MTPTPIATPARQIKGILEAKYRNPRSTKTININFQGIDTSKETSDNSKNKDKSRTNNGIKRVNNAFLRQ
jgi:hypothetical protein